MLEDTRSWPLAVSCAARVRGSDLESISPCGMTVDRGGSHFPTPHPVRPKVTCRMTQQIRTAGEVWGWHLRLKHTRGPNGSPLRLGHARVSLAVESGLCFWNMISEQEREDERSRWQYGEPAPWATGPLASRGTWGSTERGGQPCLDLRRGPQNFILHNNLKLPQSSAPTPSLQGHPVWRRPQAG